MRLLDRLKVFRERRAAHAISDDALEMQARQAEDAAQRLEPDAAVVLLRDRTGAGKTVVSIAAATLLADKKPVMRICIVAPNQTVRDRWQSTRHDLHWGITGGLGEWECLTQADLRSRERGKAPDLVIVDEAHRGLQTEGVQHALLGAFIGRARLLLVTATPFQLSTEGLIRMLTLGDRPHAGEPVIRAYGAAVNRTLHAWQRCAGNLEAIELNQAREGLNETLPHARTALEAVSPTPMAVEPPRPPVMFEVSTPAQWLVAYHTARITPELLPDVQAGDMFHRRLCSSSEAFWAGKVGKALEGAAVGQPAIRRFVEVLRRDLGAGVGHPKVKASIDWVKERVVAGRHVLVFCTFVDTQEALAAALEAEGIDHHAPDDRRALTTEIMHRFRTPPAGKPLVLVARDNLSESIDLDGGDAALLHHDLTWNPARLTQRWGRLVRRSSGFRPVPDEHHAAPILPVEIDRRLADVVAKRTHQADWMVPCEALAGEEGEENVPWAILLEARN